MPHNEELVAFSIYIVFSGLAVPLVAKLNVAYPNASAILLVLIASPMPFWVAAIRYNIHERLFSALRWHLMALVAGVLIAILGIALLALCNHVV